MGQVVLPEGSEGGNSPGELILDRFALGGPISSRLSAILSSSQKTRYSNKCVFPETKRGTKRNKSNGPSGFSIIIQRSGANN